MTPADTLAIAKRLLERRNARTTGVWPRAVALLARQALEQSLDDFWRERGIAIARLGTRPQLICLSAYVADAALAASVSHAWSSLTRACHHHAYEGASSADELRGWLEAVSDFVRRGPPSSAEEAR
jgi:hypothetical protein